MDPAAAIFPPTILEKLFHVVFQRLISTAIIQYCQANPLGIVGSVQFVNAACNYAA